MPRSKETKSGDPRDIFVPVALDLDARGLFEGRGEAIEPGLSIIDAEVPIAGLGEVDLVGLDASRRLVVIDLAGAGEAADEGRALAHAAWFRDNLPVVRRMYQLWNVRWDTPIRVVWISGGARESRESAAAAHEDASLEIERLVATPMRTRDGREAVCLSSPAAPVAPATAAQHAQARVARAAPPPRPITPSALREIEVTAAAVATRTSPRVGSRAAEAAPAALPDRANRTARIARIETDPVEREASGSEGIHSGENDVHGEGAHVEGAPLRGEAYRRELGLTQDEFAEFFVGPRAAARPAQGGGNR